MKNLLIISPDFPPLGAPQAYQSARLAKAFAQRGVNVQVVSAMSAGQWRACEHRQAVFDGLPKEISVVRFKPMKVGRRLAPVYRYFFPGDPLGFNLPLRRMIRKVSGSTHFDGFVSVAEPLVSHAAVLASVSLRSCAWRCFWFSDPVPLLGNEEMMKGKWRRARCQDICKAAVRLASRVVAVTDEIMEPFRGLDTSCVAKELVLPHSYDPEDWDDLAPIVNPREKRHLRIVHSGALYWKRSPYVLLEAVNKIQSDHPDWTVEVVLQGSIAPEIAAKVSDVARRVRVRMEGAQSYGESKQAIKHADVLCIIDVDLPRNVHLPSKVADYVGARKPILYIGRHDSPVVRVLENHPAFHHGLNSGEVASAIAELCKRDFPAYSRYQQICQRFDLNTVYAPLVDDFLRSISGNAPSSKDSS